jgi:hypothetical protein
MTYFYCGIYDIDPLAYTQNYRMFDDLASAASGSVPAFGQIWPR